MTGVASNRYLPMLTIYEHSYGNGMMTLACAFFPLFIVTT